VQPRHAFDTRVSQDTVHVSPGLDLAGIKMRTIQPMTAADYARIERELGQPIICKDGTYWRRVRPFFYRPLLVWEPIVEPLVTPPGTVVGGAQYLVTDATIANSSMSFLMYERVHEYSLAGLEHNRRRLIKHALRDFNFKPIDDLREFQERGYSAYVDFFQRTKYSYKSERTQRNEFENWAATIFAFPKAILLGGYDAKGLVAVSVSYWVNDTLVYATLFSGTDALRRNVCEGMLHVVRQLACEQPQIKQMFTRPYNGGCGMDQYYLIRGCKLVTQPAKLVLNPVTHTLLKRCFSRQYAKIHGS